MSQRLHDTLELLDLEHHSELTENLSHRTQYPLSVLEREGVCVSKLRIDQVSPGLFGRLLVRLTRDNMPPHKLGCGDIVGMFTSNIGQPEVTGTVYKVKPNTIIIAVNDMTLPEDSRCAIVLLANEVTHKKQKLAVEAALKLASHHFSYALAQVLFLEEAPTVSQTSAHFDFVNSSLNPEQKEAIQFALNDCRPVSVIHGPPGTGKTTTVVELIVQAVRKGMKVLATAPSNIAVDNMVERLAKCNIRICRLGHPARVLKTISQYCFDALLKKSDEAQIQNDIARDILRINNKLKKAARHEIFGLRQELRELRKDLKGRRGKAASEVLEHCDVILATNISAGERLIKDFAQKRGGFDLLVIDESAQALEAACWVPILLSKRLVLAGDHQQLPPTIQSEEAERRGLGVTLMARIVEAYPAVSYMLKVQYRMSESIMRWSNTQFYDGELRADCSVASRTIENYPSLIFVDTSGSDCLESGDVSKFNLREADIIKQLVSELSFVDCSVITPYNAQVEVIKNLGLKLRNGVALEVNSVDGFQGREQEVIILSLVRSNPKHIVGFLKDYRRLNVAITRAKKLVCLVCDGDTVGAKSSPDFLRSLITYFRENAEIRSPQSFEFGFAEPIHSERIEEVKSKPKKKKKNKPKPVVAEPSHRVEPDELGELKQVVMEFYHSSRTVMETLRIDGRKRAFVHQLAEDLGISHRTEGFGNGRYIILSKLVEEGSDHSLRESSSDTSEEEEVKVKIEPPKRERVVKKKVEKVIEEDDDDFLDRIIEESKYCWTKGCMKPVVNIGTDCKFCKRLFCLAHGLAEAHGCTDRAHEAARNSRFDVKPPKKPSRPELNALKLKAQQKREEERPRRQPKKKK